MSDISNQHKDSSVRKEGSFIYEDFMPTDGTDVKVYTVGPDYAHAEARKSPALDGKVERDKDGKEVRYPVILSAKEKAIARQVCIAFKEWRFNFYNSYNFYESCLTDNLPGWSYTLVRPLFELKYLK